MAGDEGADEVMQRTNLVLWRKRATFEPGTNFRAWAFECAKWTLRAYLKERKRRNWLVVDEDLTQRISERMMEVVPETPDELRLALRQCLDRLRPLDRDLVLSHYEERMPLRDFAERSGRSAGSLKVSLFRLRAALRRCVADRMAVGRSRRKGME